MDDTDLAIPIGSINRVIFPIFFPFFLLESFKYGYSLYNLIVG